MKINPLPSFLPKEIVDAVKKDAYEIEIAAEKRKNPKEIYIKGEKFYVKFLNFIRNLV